MLIRFPGFSVVTCICAQNGTTIDPIVDARGVSAQFFIEARRLNFFMDEFDAAIRHYAAQRGLRADPAPAPADAPVADEHADVDAGLREEQAADPRFCQSFLGELLIEHRALGSISAQLVQQISEAATRDFGETNSMVTRLSHIANDGTTRSAERDIRRLTQHRVDIPAPLLLNTWFADRTVEPVRLFQVAIPILPTFEIAYIYYEKYPGGRGEGGWGIGVERGNLQTGEGESNPDDA